MMTSSEHGFSLIEVLVSVFVLTVGVIGAAGMQLTALRTAQQSAFQTRALHLAADMADMMRANVEQMRLDDSANPYLLVDYQSSPGTDHSPTRSCYSADRHCDAEQLALFDIAQLLQRIDRDLPGGRIRICRDALPWNAKTGHFVWNCALASSTAAVAPLVIKIGWQEKNQNSQALQDHTLATPHMVLTVASYSK